MPTRFIPYLTAAVMAAFFTAWLVVAIADGPAWFDFSHAIEGE